MDKSQSSDKEVKIRMMQKDILNLLREYPEFATDLFEFLLIFRNTYYDNNRFSMQYKGIFRIITDRVRDGDREQPNYKIWKEAVEDLANDHHIAFAKFKELVKYYTPMYGGLGYNEIYNFLNSIWEEIDLWPEFDNFIP